MDSSPLYMKNMDNAASTIEGADSFGILYQFVLYSLYVYCTACSSFLKVVPILQINQIVLSYEKSNNCVSPGIFVQDNHWAGMCDS